jgi:CCR4-NOT transcription complex subunit 7/8
MPRGADGSGGLLPPDGVPPFKWQGALPPPSSAVAAEAAQRPLLPLVAGCRVCLSLTGVFAGRTVHVVDVWEANLEEEMSKIRKMVETYPYVSLVSFLPPASQPWSARPGDPSQHTEFPGVVVRPLLGGAIGTGKVPGPSVEEYHYETIRVNVDSLHVIQIGLSLCDHSGALAPGQSTWQFNFRFDVSREIVSADAIALLHRAGVNFVKHAAHGIDPAHFGELLTVSGLVLVRGPKWVTFHSGYDMAYLLKVCDCAPGTIGLPFSCCCCSC